MAELTLAELIDAETSVVDQFIILLEREQTALQEGKTDPLPEIADAKAPLTIRLNELAIKRNQALSMAGLPADRAGIESWIQRYPVPEVATAWKKLHASIGKARELNEVNGKLIVLRLQYTNQALNALTVAQRTSGTLYGPDGQTSALAGRRIIDAV